ncbi:hypothetical protein GQ457_12G004680 [Hibiscus cannabinus]
MGKSIQVYGFPPNITALEVKTFLENYTGIGTVFAVKIRPTKAKAYALVQFTKTADAERITSLASQGLWCPSSQLEVREMETELVSNPKFYLHTTEAGIMHFGCKVSEEKTLVLWTANNVTVKFVLAMKKLLFLLSYVGLEHKLELYLLLQGYMRECALLEYVPDDPSLNYYKDVPDYQWVRTTDFSQLYCIGQSYTICLELPHNVQLPDFEEYFDCYKENNGRLFLETVFPYSCHPTLVSSVCPMLPFEVLFKVNMLVQNGCIPGPALDDDFYKMVDPSRVEKLYIDAALEKLYQLKQCCDEPSRWLHEEYNVYTRSKKHPVPPAISLDYDLVYVRRVQITPSRIYFSAPEINDSNRVLRQFCHEIDNFLRISFVDEGLEKIHSTNVQARGRRTINYGKIQPGCLLPRKGFTAADIRSSLGDFSEIRNVAKYAVRLGQSFSSSTETLSVNKDEINLIPDIEIVNDGIKYVFSDGLGKISAEFAKKVAAKCHLNPKNRVPGSSG